MKTATEQKLYKKTCGRCGGKGKYHTLTHVANDVCFKCDGLGYELVKISPEARAKAEARKEAKRQQEKEYWRIKTEQWNAESSILIEKYRNDSRMSEYTKRVYASSIGQATDIARGLDEIDRGVRTPEKTSILLRNIARAY